MSGSPIIKKSVISKKPVVKITKQVSLKRKVVQRKEIDVSRLVPTPCIPLNLECSGRHEGGFSLGSIVNLIGDSHAGKTLFALSILAECSLLSRFDEYELEYDDVESANEFDTPYLFGTKCAERINENHRSKTFEDFADRISNLIDSKQKFIYILDSFDALTTRDAIKLEKKNRLARSKDNKESGSYGDGKPKLASEFFSMRAQDIDDSESLVIIISQTRDNLGFGAMFNPKVRSGGRALKFYSAFEIWLAMQKKEKIGKRTLITDVQAKLTKNKLTGRHGEAIFPILFDYGIDNIAACINFLTVEGTTAQKWTGTKSALNTKGFYVLDSGKHPSYKDIVRHIEENDLEKELALVCQASYDASIEALRSDRKRRY